MTPEEAIAKIAAEEWLAEGIWCAFCHADREIGAPHADDCPWLALQPAKSAEFAKDFVAQHGETLAKLADE